MKPVKHRGYQIYSHVGHCGCVSLHHHLTPSDLHWDKLVCCCTTRVRVRVRIRIKVKGVSRVRVSVSIRVSVTGRVIGLKLKLTMVGGVCII